MVKEDKKMSNHIEEYFVQREAHKEILASKELFTAQKENVDVKTDLNFKEILVFNKLLYNDHVLNNHKLIPVFYPLTYQYFRLKISLDRKSRGEFVNVNVNKDNVDDVLSRMSNISNITESKK